MHAVVRRTYPLIERRADDDVDGDIIARDYAAKGRPVVIRSSKVEPLRAWSPATLRNAFGDCLVDAEETEKVFVDDRARRRLPLSRLLDGVLAGEKSLRWKGLDLLSVIRGMNEHLVESPPTSDGLLPTSTESTRRALWLAPKGTMSSFHHDGNSDNYNWQVHGKKLFLLVPPRRFEDLYAYGSAESPINPFNPEFARFPRFANAEPMEATLHPGDVLLIPKYWWHCVYTVEPSVNLNTWFSFRGELSPWRALEGVPLFHRACAALAAELKRRRLLRLAKTTRRVWYAAYAQLKERPLPEPRVALLDP